MEVSSLFAIMSPSIWTALAAVALATLLLTLRLARQPLQQSIASPRDSLLPRITPKQAAALPYPPDILPGARDVGTPHGVMRVYEWGPKDGKKILFIHGDTTPAPILGPVAHELVKRGCRVMMFDLWGRGYSDTPLGVPHDAKLYGMQIFFAAASSALSWTGAESGGFSVVGFSLGGGIAMAFAADFPYLINSIILLAPGGILRSLPDEYESVFYRCPSLLPSSYLKSLVAKTLGLKISHSPIGYSDLHDQSQMSREMHQEAHLMGKAVLDISGISQWQFDNHKGFIHSFTSTLLYGPIQHQHSDWRRVCNIIKGDTAHTSPSSHSSKLFNSKILFIFGEADSIVRPEEVSADILDIICDPEHVEFKFVSGGHGFPVPSCDEVAKQISDFCGLESGNQ